MFTSLVSSEETIKAKHIAVKYQTSSCVGQFRDVGLKNVLHRSFTVKS